MKEKDAFVDFPAHETVMFVEKDDGRYDTMQTGSFLAKNYFDDYLDKQRKLLDSLRSRFVAGEISPVAYFMTLRDMAPADVAARVGVRTRTVRKHMLPAHFRNMKLSMAVKYADVFGIPVAQFFKVPSQSGSGSPAPADTAAKKIDCPSPDEKKGT